MRLFFLPDKLLHILINTTPKKRFVLLGGLGAGSLFLPAAILASLSLSPSTQPVVEKQVGDSGMSVLAAETQNPNFVFNVNVPSFFSDTATFQKDATIQGGLTVQGKAVFANGVDVQGNDINLGTGKVTASNILYSISAGDGLIITDGQTPTITNTGVLSLGGKSGKLSLEAGSGITIDGLKISASGNTDQNVFTTVAVSGQSDITTSSTTDTLTFAAGTGITLTTDATTKKVTITATGGGGGAGVDSVDGLSGGLTIANTSGSGSTITIDNASTSQKGIAQFNSTNFSVSSGIVNLIQSIATSASPSFVGMTLSALTTNGGLLYTDASGVLSQLGVGTSGQQLTSNGTGSAPSWQDPAWHVSGPDAYRSGNVGIATPDFPTTPGLTVYQYSQSNWMIRTRTGTVDNSSGFWQDSSKNIQVQARDGSGVLRLVLDTNASGNSYLNAGNVGIGTTSPGQKLDVNGNIRSSDGTFVAQIKGDSGGPRITFGDTGDPESLFGIGAYNSVNNIDTKGRNLRIYSTSDTTGLTYLATGGNFGIGSTTPNEKLDIAGRMYLGDTTAPGTTTNRLYAVSGGLYWNGTQVSTVGGAGSSQWTTSGSDISYSLGNVGIGTTSPLFPLDVRGNASSSGTLSAYSGFNAISGGYKINGSRVLNASSSLSSVYVGLNAGNPANTNNYNTGLGHNVMTSASLGSYNTATGYEALKVNAGNYNTAIGAQALQADSGASFNVALGAYAMYRKVGDSYNTAIGYAALSGADSSSGQYNTALGASSLDANTFGQYNVAVGYQAGTTATSGNANVSGSNNVFLGYQSGPGSSTQISNAIAIGSGALVSTSNSLVLGATGTSAVKVGIGTTTPLALLHVTGGNKSGNAAFILDQTGASTNDLFTASSSGTTKFTINNSGQLFLANGTAPGTTTNMLYANGGDLYWNGVAITNGGGLDGASPWGTSGNNIYYSAGNVGVGTTNAAALFQIKGTTQTNLSATSGNTGVAGALLTSTYGASGGVLPGLVWSTSDNNATKPKAGIWTTADDSGSHMYIGTSNSFGTGITNTALAISPAGGLGLGVNDAQNSLMHLYGGSGVLLRLGNPLSNVDDTSDIAFGSSNGTDWAKIGSIVEGTGDMGLAFYTTDDGGNDGTPERMRITHNGKVNIGGPTGSEGALNLNQDGIYSYNNSDSGRFIRFNTNGLYNDLLSGGSRLVINWDGAQDVTMFENSPSNGTGNLGIGVNPSAKLHLVKGDAGDTSYATGNWLAKFYNQTDADGEGGLVVGTRWYNQNTPVFSAGTICDSCGSAGFDTFFTVRGTGNVGIGTTDPSEKLDLTGAMHLSDVTAPGDTTNKLYAVGGALYWNGTDLTAGGGASSWSLNGSKLYYSDGNVGIGTSDPASIFDIRGDFEDGGGSGLRILGTNGHGSVLDIIQEGSNSWGLGMLPGNNSLGFFSNYSNSNSYDGERMRLTGGGNLGIGTTDPQSRLHVDLSGGTIPPLYGGTDFILSDTQSDFSNTIAAILSGDAAESILYFGDSQAENSGAIRYDNSTDTLKFVTNANPRMTIDDVGNVGIGTTSTSYPLTVGTDGTNGNGAYLSEGGDWTNGSSRNFKENYTDLNKEDILTKINSLSVQKWNYKGDTNAKHIGPFAEDFYSTFNVGNDNKHISTIDPAGVALVGIQALSKQIDDLRSQMGIASISANFAPTAQSLGLSQENATISGMLTVLGRTTVNDLGVTGKIVSGLTSIDGAEGSINVVGDLKLQSNGLGKVDLFAGKVTVDNKGNIKTEGTLTAKKVNIDTTDVAGASAGVGKVTSGSQTVTISTNAVTDKSLIQVTFNDDYAPATRYWIASKSAGTSFTVKLDQAVSSDAKFNWWIVN